MPTLCLHIWIFDWILVGPRIAVDVADRLGCLEELEALEPDDALALDEENIRHWLSGHDRVALPPGGLERFRAIPGPFEWPSMPFFKGPVTGQELRRLPPPWEEEPKLLPPVRGRRSGRRLKRSAA